MTRTTLPIAVALAASAGLLLTACGGGGSDSSDKIPASSAASTTAVAVTTTPSATPAAGAPTFDLPPDITTDFRGFTSSDPTKQAILTDAKYAAMAVLEFEAKTYTKETPNFKRFWTGAHGAAFADSIIAQGRDGSVITGHYPYYHPVVKTFSTGNVSVQYCEDQRKAYAKDGKTGKVSVTKPSLSDFHQWTLLMTKGSDGEWTVYQHSWIEGAKQCQIA